MLFFFRADLQALQADVFTGGGKNHVLAALGAGLFHEIGDMMEDGAT